MNTKPRYNPASHHRRSIRLKGYDYSQAGAYFITLCTHNREWLFGGIVEEIMRLNPYGEIAATCWRSLGQHFDNCDLSEWVVMPNHLHGIIVLSDPGKGEASPDERLRKSRMLTADASPLFNGTQPGSVGAIVQNYKSIATRKINAQRHTPGLPVWQRNYYEHIIRNEKSHYDIATYIVNNPAQWEMDKLYSKGTS